MSGWDHFAFHFPVSYSLFDRLFGGKPQEEYSKPGSKAGRVACGKLAAKKIVLCPLSLPFLTLYSFGLSLLKLAELSARSFTLLAPSKKHVRQFVNNAKQATDYLMLTGLMPVKIVAEIVKLISAAIFDSRYYFSPPELYPIPIQISYYQEIIEKCFYRLRIARQLNLQIKAELHEIDKVQDKIFKNLKDKTKRLDFLKAFRIHLKQIGTQKVDSKDLEGIRCYCEDFSQKERIAIEFVVPQNRSLNRSQDDSLLDSSTSTSFKSLPGSEREVVVEVGLTGDQNVVVDLTNGDDSINNSSVADTGSADS